MQDGSYKYFLTGIIAVLVFVAMIGYAASSSTSDTADSLATQVNECAYAGGTRNVLFTGNNGNPSDGNYKVTCLDGSVHTAE